MGASDFNRALRSKRQAKFGAFGCRSEEYDLGIIF